MKLLNMLMNDKMALKYTPVCLIHYFIYLACYPVDPIVPDIHGKLTNGKTNNFIKNTINICWTV